MTARAVNSLIGHRSVASDYKFNDVITPKLIQWVDGRSILIYAQAVKDILIMFISVGVWMAIFKGFKKSDSEAEKLYTV